MSTEPALVVFNDDDPDDLHHDIAADMAARWDDERPSTGGTVAD